MRRLEVIAVEGIGEVQRGASLAELICEACARLGLTLADGDVLVVAHKIVSKAEGRVMRLDEIAPSARALELARALDKDPRVVEAILRESRNIVRMGGTTLIVETHHGFVCANAGVDLSNVGLGSVGLLPEDPDRSAAKIRQGVLERTGIAVGVIVSDSFGRPWRLGTTDVALGVSGLNPLKDYRGGKDRYGYELRASVAAVADEIASAAELVMGKKDGIPVVVVRGFPIESNEGSGRDLLRPEKEDLFRKF
ncbi:MAG TPA: coenzyme F420-0:L-glutamate ligase [Candidatus Acidoferrales bacterium]|nr:coenzyme F420-0:L-glutamate ligase [Candidatus Acidoferrales bacterium]